MRNESLGQRARREAIISRPAFSLALHARLRQAVLGTPRPMPAEVKSPNRFKMWVSTSAAALLLVAATIGWQRRESPQLVAPVEPEAGVAQPVLATAGPIAPTEPIGVTAVEEPKSLLALADATATELDQFMATAVEGHQWADYDFDIQEVLKEYAEQLPIDLSPALAWSGLVAEEEQ